MAAIVFRVVERTIQFSTDMSSQDAVALNILCAV